MKNTIELRQKMIRLWKTFDAGKITAQEARCHIGFARTVLDSVKVEIAAAHLDIASIPAVELSGRRGAS